MNKANMLIMKPKVTGVSFPSPVKCGGSPGGRGGCEAAAGLEVRPCGMYVQKRTKDTKPCVPNITVKVKYGSYFHEVTLSSQASFGELKKMLAGKIGLNPQDQKLMFKEKERDSKAFLDVVGVKDGSKIVLIEDELSKERRILESRRNAKMERAANDIAAIRLEVSKLAKQVASIESTVKSGKKVEELVLWSLTESLMIQLIKLDGISADGEIKLQRRMEVKRAQKYIEILDSLKPMNSDILNKPRQENLHEQSKPRNFALRNKWERVVITTEWETF
ncbi:BAG family molecular chaperone regulator 1-like [Primulina eburnea]|uniref:BAG family molecular chaperone regulator 1-like n=1 Tax=Primulina eburnea TaxID=1245227 RepID=UPI003C6C4632